MYDYLIVGSGLFGSVFAHEMHKKKNPALSSNAVPMLAVIFTVRTRMALTSIPMAPIFFTRRTKKSGTT